MNEHLYDISYTVVKGTMAHQAHERIDRLLWAVGRELLEFGSDALDILCNLPADPAKWPQLDGRHHELSRVLEDYQSNTGLRFLHVDTANCQLAFEADNLRDEWNRMFVGGHPITGGQDHGMMEITLYGTGGRWWVEEVYHSLPLFMLDTDDLTRALGVVMEWASTWDAWLTYRTEGEV